MKSYQNIGQLPMLQEWQKSNEDYGFLEFASATLFITVHWSFLLLHSALVRPDLCVVGVPELDKKDLGKPPSL